MFGVLCAAFVFGSASSVMAISKLTRQRVYERDGYRCVACGSAAKKLSLDHIYPKSLGGIAVFENLQTMCRPCNVRKGAQVPEGCVPIVQPKSRDERKTERRAERARELAAAQSGPPKPAAIASGRDPKPERPRKHGLVVDASTVVMQVRGDVPGRLVMVRRSLGEIFVDAEDRDHKWLRRLEQRRA